MSDGSGQYPTGGQPPASYPPQPGYAPTPPAPQPGYAPPPPGYAPPPPGYAPQPGYAPPVGYAPPPAPVKKKGRGCIIAAAIVGGLMACCVAVTAFAVLNASKPRDLGVRYSEADYWRAVDKAGVEIVDAAGPEAPPVPAGEDIEPAEAAPTAPPAPGAKPAPPRATRAKKPAAEDWSGTETIYSGTRRIDLVFTDAEVSALLNYSHMGGWPLSSVQVRFPGGDAVEMSGIVMYEGTAYPFYVSGNAAMSGSALSGSLGSVQAAGFTVPAEYYPAATDYALSLINERLSRLGGLDITTAEVVDGGLHLAGTIPARVERTRR